MVYQTFKQTVENMTEVERNQLAFSIGIIIMCLIGLFIILIDLYKNKKKLKKVKKEAIKKESKLKNEVLKQEKKLKKEERRKARRPDIELAGAEYNIEQDINKNNKVNKEELNKLIYVDTKVITYKDENFDENDENFITYRTSSSNINCFPFLPINRR